MSPDPAPSWRLVVPVKGGAGAKSRLQPPRGVTRAALASAIARDCLTAACAALPEGRVHVVTSDDAVRSYAVRLGAAVVTDPGRGLNEAVRAGLRAAVGDAADGARSLGPAAGPRRSGGPVPVEGVGVLLGDLPALRPSDLEEALTAAAAHPRALVPDADGTGTVLLTAVGAPLEPAFGADSAARHAAAGHRRLDLDLPRLRTDVDDDEALRAALALGVGPATLAVLAGTGATLPGMQASVHTFDEATGSGTALLDDGREVAFTAEVFARSALRHLRPGQRLSIDLARGTTTVERLWIVGIGDDQRIG
ncbi:NTP transferase domain-containing protein [Knoellia sp. 3-2P3]|uniref:NTP transferase domain-containing protein n=1 Tax=unclassified Knoellia TaxID=2618719 RepID=UPI0023DB69E2|nr:NTP transferase domain-containing protein [Knoellia sp. 3-2P3]MDF2094001.1 NTP transferase domain-containing protein [Knoellia sp. 3-2P3]